ncbi:TPA: protein kinase [Pseudomonas aeruginosa]|uniref:protein kinase n=1 Tax=Pseudomonas aeruginosa TaxID=287 RepID=UPI0021ADB05E|nr:protein kinase [Pseudomonas aeruginosa]MDX4009992.1 protein kinase [Pseudomonas aeruginosa]MEB5091475.1 protein kinase [Pseudomonas aeruginosa]MEB5097688.1 protein kinase [Pseudomonas aeruginosa]MEB5109681.1 protein kinase [Pseudomonas aeruginosa]MEB5161736.1 protein kinase [Pseudomonas aeruginosa]
MLADKRSSSKRIDEVDVRLILQEIDRWRHGSLGSELTWAVLEKFSGFSRQSLHARPEIKAAYQEAKIALRSGLAKTRVEAVANNEALQTELDRLKLQLAVYEEREAKWRARWQRIAYHLRAGGFTPSHLDKPIPIGVKGISGREADNVLRPFDKEIPPARKN